MVRPQVSGKASKTFGLRLSAISAEDGKLAHARSPVEQNIKEKAEAQVTVCCPGVCRDRRMWAEDLERAKALSPSVEVDDDDYVFVLIIVKFKES